MEPKSLIEQVVNGEDPNELVVESSTNLLKLLDDYCVRSTKTAASFVKNAKVGSVKSISSSAYGAGAVVEGTCVDSRSDTEYKWMLKVHFDLQDGEVVIAEVNHPAYPAKKRDYLVKNPFNGDTKMLMAAAGFINSYG